MALPIVIDAIARSGEEKHKEVTISAREARLLENEPTFHTKADLVIPTWPLRGTTWAGYLWMLVPPSWRMRLYRLLTSVARKLGYTAEPLSRVQRLPFNLYAKYAGKEGVAEALATLFVRENTTILVPEILDVIELPRDTFILMTRLPGKPLAAGLKTMDATSTALLKEDLRNWLFQLRSLKPPPNTKVGSLIGTSSTQFRISSYEPLGPYSTIDELHQDILSRLDPEAAKAVAQKSYSKPHRLCFTHSDLNPGNLLMHNGRLSGLVDFGSSGWFPEYWDGGAACWGMSLHYPQWVNIFHSIFPQYPDESEVEEILCDQINPY